MKENRRKAFTLMEMLVVIVIIGIILAIVLPNVRKLSNSQNQKMYETHMDVVVENAVDLYVDQYKGELLDENSQCFNINYQTFIKDNLIKETEVFCDGNVIVRRNENTKDTENSYYLTCHDKSGDEINKSEKVPSGCRGFNGKFKMEYEIYEDANRTKKYDGSYYVKNAYVFFTSTSPYSFPIEHYEYSVKLDGSWKKIASGSNLGSINDTKNLNGNLHVRAVDEDKNESSSVQIPVKLDNSGPEFTTNITGDWLTKKLTISNAVDKLVGKLAESPYSFDGGKTWQKENTLDYTENKTVQVCVKDSLDNQTCKDVVISGIDRVVPNPPTVTASDQKAGGTWHSANFTLTLSGANNLSGNTYYYGETNNPTTQGTNLSITTDTTSKTYYMKVCSGAGYCSAVTSYEVKLDKSKPAVPTITANDNIASNNWHKTDFILTANGSTAISGINYYYGTSNPTTEGSNISVSVNTSSTTYYVKACSGAGICSDNGNYVAMLDKTAPTITANSANNYITTTTGSNIQNYFTITTSISGGSTSCTVENTNNLSLGVNTVTCTTTSGSGLQASASTTFKHQYNATLHCSSGRTLSGGNCVYTYTNNETKCGCKTKNSCESGAYCGYNSASCRTAGCGIESYQSCPNEAVCGCSEYRCTLYKKCTVCSCPGWSNVANCNWSAFSSDCMRKVGSNSASKNYGRHSECGSETVYGSECNNANSRVCNQVTSCPNSSCAVNQYKECADAACGNGSAKSCVNPTCTCAVGNDCTITENDYRYYSCDSVGNNGTNGTLSGSTCSF